MKLFQMRVEFDMIVLAEDEGDAMDVTRREASRALSDCDATLMSADEITKPEDVPADWVGCYPYGYTRAMGEELTVDAFLRRAASSAGLNCPCGKDPDDCAIHADTASADGDIS